MTLTPVIVPVLQEAAPRSPRQVQLQREASRTALRLCARRCGAPADGWKKDDRGAPLPSAGHFWSVSHKRHWAAAVIADCAVGIDIEHLAPRPRELHDAIASDDEWRLLGERSWLAFFRLWTAKEAVLKAGRVGLAGLPRCRLVAVLDETHLALSYGGREWMVEHYYHDEHIVAVTTGGAPVSWNVLGGTMEGASAEEPSRLDRESSQK